MTLPPSRYRLHPVDRHDPDALAALLEVYRQCEDFLALGPRAYASVEMVLADLETAQVAGRMYCGVYACPLGELIGVTDYLSAGFDGVPQHAFLELLMIALHFRGQGLGSQIVADLEEEILKDPQIRAIRLGVQENNPGALRFWQRCGYSIIRPAELMPDQTIAYLMEKLF